MIKNTWDKNENASANKKEITVLKEHFPACFKEDGSFDIERFKEYLSEDINVVNEGYELKFLGKNYARLLVTLETETVIVPNEEHNQKEENKNSENIYITGDNLDGLKHLLKSYAGKVKCIYIDPPYNTGSDGFVYNDNFNFTIEELTEKLSIGEEQAQRILDLTKRGSASHSAWLMFMYPRLQLARDLLSDDGVIFISIDDNEQANLKLLCDEVLGEENFVSLNIHKNNSNKNQTNLIGVSTEYVCCYVKSKDSLDNVKWRVQKKGTRDIHALFSRLKKQGYSNDKILEEVKDMYKRPKYSHLSRWNKVDDKGVFKDADLSRNGGPKDYTIINPHTGEECVIPNRGWGKSYEELLRLQEEDLIYYGDPNTPPGFKDYINSDSPTVVDSFWYFDNSTDTRFLRELFGGDVFDNPKPVEMIQQILEFTTNENDIIVDFFAGSSTTAHAVMNANTLNNHNLKYIMIQLDEEVQKNSFAFESGYKTIDQIGRDRITKCSNIIKDNNEDLKKDLGFKHFILKKPTNDTINKLVEFTPKKDEMIINNTILDEFGVPTVITTWLNNDGYGLTTEAEKILFADYEAYYKDKHLYLVHPELPNEAIEELVVKYETDGSFNPENIVLFGYSFTWTELESLKTNLKRLQDTEKNLRINFDVRY
ncbi:site-specific DNA-methyltransferase [Savagea sp. SN6]|uniref:Site-specific DNA-methyltransferase n=1 Tax=Savagea serpentis TaxID=2785297 RepID=A0A8J7KCL8_9BACL|nr:DNA methyltransferase [Savagea serpentis]MBF4501652.1 site-specific DNA-methyltransferase [Savagea serpentis]